MGMQMGWMSTGAFRALALSVCAHPSEQKDWRVQCCSYEKIGRGSFILVTVFNHP